MTLDRPGLVRGLVAAGPDTTGSFHHNHATPPVLAAILVRATGGRAGRSFRPTG